MDDVEEIYRSDQTEANRICPFSRTTTCYAADDHEPHMIGDGCRRWQCPVCGPRMKHRLVLRIVAAKPNRMLTLTCRHEGTADDQYRRIHVAWPKLIRDLRRECSGSERIEYFRMTEQCKDGFPHFHALLRSPFISQKRIKESWTTHAGATIVDIRKAHGRSVAYVAKYLHKARDANNTFSRQRTSVSKGFFPPDTSPSQFTNFDHSNEHPYEFAHRKSAHCCFVRRRPTLYRIEDRTEGDELPPELVPPFRD